MMNKEELLKEAGEFYDKHIDKKYQTKEQFLETIERNPHFLNDCKSALKSVNN